MGENLEGSEADNCGNNTECDWNSLRAEVWQRERLRQNKIPVIGESPDRRL